MNNNQRNYIFIGCLFLRACIAYGAKVTPKKHLPMLAVIALIPTIGFAYNYFSNSPKVGGFGGLAWWAPMRIVHATMFLLFTIGAANRNQNAWALLAVDVVIGVISHISLKGS